MSELKNCENCKYRRIRKSRRYPCMCCELLNPISFNLKWEEEQAIEEGKYESIRYNKSKTNGTGSL